MSNSIKLTNTSFQNIKVGNGNTNQVVINGVTEHDKLKNRDIPNQHPISAIEGLQEKFIGLSKLYVGSGDMPEDYNIQIDPSGTIEGCATNVILSNTMTKDEIVSSINNAEPGTVFDIQTSLELYDVSIAFPEESVIYSSKGRASILFGYSDETLDGDYWENSYDITFGNRCRIYDISLSIASYGTSYVVGNFGVGCISTNCNYDSYVWGSMGTNCIFLHCNMGIYELSYLGNNNSYIGCYFVSNADWVGLEIKDVCLLDCQADRFIVVSDNNEEALAKIKALNPGMNIVDAEGNEIKGLYATKKDIGNIETALDNIIDIQNSLIGGDA